MIFVRDDLRPVRRRTVVFLACFVLAFAVIAFRLFSLQVVQAPYWRSLAENNRLRRLPLEAPRGLVTDCNGQVVMDNRPAFQLLLFPEEMKEPERTIQFLTRLGLAEEGEVRARVARAQRTSHLPSVIADNLSWAQMAAVAAHRADFQELAVHPATRRAVPAGPAVAHLVGQLGEVSPAQLAADSRLRPSQLVGKSGIELSYQEVLGGVPGNLVVVVDALGRQVSTLDEEPPKPGHPLTLTVDLELQREAAKAMAGLVGSVVGIDPRDGAVRVLLSEPSFDPDLFAGHLEPARWASLVADPLNPLQNRALQALYPPGSTIKPIFAAGALADGVRTPAQSVYCTGTSTIYGHPYRCWLAGGHGHVSLERGIEVSCDTFFYRLAFDAGLTRLAAWARRLGLGEKTGIELAGEMAGLVPSDEWSRRSRGHPWYAGETISVGIGQGPILVTPLQLAVAYAALVNGGFLVTPHLVPEGGKPPRPTGIDPAVLATVRRGMERVVAGEQGTARRLASLPVAIAGKTGTSQVMRKKEGVKWQELPWEQRHHALFVGYAPPAEPTLVVVAVVEHGGDASSVAAPIVARILAKAFGHDVEISTPQLLLANPSYQPEPTPPSGGPAQLAEVRP
jgi:penicillin-binding protein 2